MYFPGQWQRACPSPKHFPPRATRGHRALVARSGAVSVCVRSVCPSQHSCHLFWGSGGLRKDMHSWEQHPRAAAGRRAAAGCWAGTAPSHCWAAQETQKVGVTQRGTDTSPLWQPFPPPCFPTDSALVPSEQDILQKNNNFPFSSVHLLPRTQVTPHQVTLKMVIHL